MKPFYLLAVLVLCGSGAWGQDFKWEPVPTSPWLRVYGEGRRLLLSCKTNDPATGCVLAKGATLDEAIDQILKSERKNAEYFLMARPEPIDVPALWIISRDGKGEWTCVDKTRIRMADEEMPPKWWCHKVQTGD